MKESHLKILLVRLNEFCFHSMFPSYYFYFLYDALEKENPFRI